MSNDDEKGALRKEIEDARLELRQTADEIRVKLHLASMDAKDAWEKLEPRLHEFEQRIDHTSEAVGQELKELGRDIMKHLRAIRDQVS